MRWKPISIARLLQVSLVVAVCVWNVAAWGAVAELGQAPAKAAAKEEKPEAQRQLEAAQKQFGGPALGKILDDPEPLGRVLLVIGVAIAAGAVLAYHPFRRKKSLEDLDQPKTTIIYTVVGALVAIVVAAMPEMGLAVFGIGGLMRFRTDVGAAKETGRVILATLLGLACGLELWIVVILGAGIAWVLIAVLDYRVSMRMVVRGVKPEVIPQVAAEYGLAVAALGCRVSHPRRNPLKGQVSFVIRARRGLEQEDIESACQSKVPVELRGTLDWPEE